MIADNPHLDHKIPVNSDYESSLGSIANKTAAHSIQAKKSVDRTRKYKHLGFAQHLLIENNVTSPRSERPHRTRFCHTRIAYNQNNVVIKLNRDDLNSEAKISHVQTCTSFWACPICAETIAIKKAQEIREALQYADAKGLLPVMLTLTARHDVGMRLVGFKSDFKKAWKLFSNHRQWKKFKKEYGFKHKIVVREVTRGDCGWHYHMHILIFMDKLKLVKAEQDDTLQEALRDHWMHCLAQAGLDARRDKALVLTTGETAGELYLTKLGIAPSSADGDLSYELTGVGKQDSRTIWDILRHAYYGNEGDDLLYIEYVKAMTGDNWITWSKGLHDLVNEFMEEHPNEDEPEAQSTHKWLNISNYWWTLVKMARAYHIIVDVSARTRDIEAVRRALHTIRSDLLEADMLPEQHRNLLPRTNSIVDIWIHEEW